MMGYRLCSPRQIEATLGAFFQSCRSARLSVCEERAFKDAAFLDLGAVLVVSSAETPAGVAASIRQGGFEWSVPSKDTVEANLRELLGFTAQTKATEVNRLSASLNAIARISVRAGLTRPRFDAHAV